MTFAEVFRRHMGALVAIGLLPIAAYPLRAGAVEQAYHLDGKVSRVMGAATAGLKNLGVEKDAAVAIDWAVELGAITAFKIQIGSWIAQGVDPSLIDDIVTAVDGP